MFYCPNCDNTYDIARTSGQSGGVPDFEFSSSETISEEQVGGINIGELIKKILIGTSISPFEIKKIDVKNLVRHIEYKKLTQTEKEIIFNTIQDLLPKDQKKLIKNKPVEQGENNLAFFVCSNCKYFVKIKEGTRIFSRTSNNVSQSYGTSDYSDMLNSKILPRTRKYICKNSKCITHKVPSKKEAVFFRKNNSFETIYICAVCGTSS
jgi:hypothetical protein